MQRKNIIKPHKPELLAPAGSLKTGIIALQNGADAVYAGLNDFNARHRSKNFTVDEMQTFIEYAHSINKKVYVTFNTLIKESELYNACKSLEQLAQICPDAVIIQDLGVLYAIKKYFSHLTVHASTQMAVHNSPGVNILAELGVERVILERQITNDELAVIAENAKAELEVFVHGALCCSLSGSCLLSSWLGGWSGNRGKCKQACRRRYYAENENESGFYLSTKDLYGLENINFFKKLKISSLKIEGRLREADYVANTVKAYRMVINDNSNSLSIIKEAKRLLATVPSRDWSNGFSTFESLNKIINSSKIGVQGRHCGKIIKVLKNGFEFKAVNSVKIKDKIRIQPQNGDEGPSITVTALKSAGKNVAFVKKGQIGFIFCDKKVKKGWHIYKLAEIDKNTYKSVLSDLKNSVRLIPRITINENEIKVDILNVNGIPKWTEKINAERALNVTLNCQILNKLFGKKLNDIFYLTSVKCSIQEGIFIPHKILKEAAKKYLSWLKQGLSGSFKPEFVSKIQLIKRDINEVSSLCDVKPEKNMLKTYAVNSLNSIKEKNVFKALPLNEALKYANNFDRAEKNSEISVILPFFCPETGLNTLRLNIKKCIKAGFIKFRISSLFQIYLLKDFNNIIYETVFPLPVTNSFAVKRLLQCNFKKIQLWVELEKNEIQMLADKFKFLCEQYIYGRISVLNTRARIPVSGIIKDKRGIKFKIVNDAGLYKMLPEKIFKIQKVENCSVYVDLINADINEENHYTFNYNGCWS